MLVLNAGIFPAGCRIDALSTHEWNKVMRINLDSNLVFMREAHPLLKLAPKGGRVVIIGSKNVPARVRRGGVFGFQGGIKPARARGGAGMGRG